MIQVVGGWRVVAHGQCKKAHWCLGATGLRDPLGHSIAKCLIKGNELQAGAWGTLIASRCRIGVWVGNGVEKGEGRTHMWLVICRTSKLPLSQSGSVWQSWHFLRPEFLPGEGCSSSVWALHVQMPDLGMFPSLTRPWMAFVTVPS